MSLNDDLSDLESAEDFLDYFAVPYERSIVHVNRLHILQRFHDYLAKTRMPPEEDSQRTIYRHHLTRAYEDFVRSDAATEKVFKVFTMHEPKTVTVPLSAIQRRPKQ